MFPRRLRKTIFNDKVAPAITWMERDSREAPLDDALDPAFNGFRRGGASDSEGLEGCDFHGEILTDSEIRELILKSLHVVIMLAKPVLNPGLTPRRFCLCRHIESPLLHVEAACRSSRRRRRGPVRTLDAPIITEDADIAVGRGRLRLVGVLDEVDGRGRRSLRILRPPGEPRRPAVRGPRVVTSSRPASAEVAPAGPADRGEALIGGGDHGFRLRGQRARVARAESAPRPSPIVGIEGRTTLALGEVERQCGGARRTRPARFARGSKIRICSFRRPRFGSVPSALL